MLAYLRVLASAGVYTDCAGSLFKLLKACFIHALCTLNACLSSMLLNIMQRHFAGMAGILPQNVFVHLWRTYNSCQFWQNNSESAPRTGIRAFWGPHRAEPFFGINILDKVLVSDNSHTHKDGKLVLMQGHTWLNSGTLRVLWGADFLVAGRSMEPEWASYLKREWPGDLLNDTGLSPVCDVYV